jgi:glutamate dehydrogenase
VARGGIRWSDRREDFRTEVLGLVKAQMVKNAVIVPVGAKGGFVLKQAPPSSDREAFHAEGVACYRQFISALLDVTDNIVAGSVVAPKDVVRHDVDDPYLVVAADKGTATFSDIANEISQSYGFWLGDAFASGGSAGYDHKRMGITARGAWESVKRHFREMNVDIQSQDFTAVGIGDMSGDVFGNGMLLSEHIRLVGAGCSICRVRPGTTTTGPCCPPGAASGRVRPRPSRSRRRCARRWASRMLLPRCPRPS